MMNFLCECGRTLFFPFALLTESEWEKRRLWNSAQFSVQSSRGGREKNKKQELALVTVITLWLYNSNILPGLMNIHLQHLNHLHSRSCRLNISHLQKWSRIRVTNALMKVTFMSYLFFISWWLKRRWWASRFACSQDVRMSSSYLLSSHLDGWRNNTWQYLKYGPWGRRQCSKWWGREMTKF